MAAEPPSKDPYVIWDFRNLEFLPLIFRSHSQQAMVRAHSKMLDEKTGLRRRVKRSQGKAVPPLTASLRYSRSDMVQDSQW